MPKRFDVGMRKTSDRARSEIEVHPSGKFLYVFAAHQRTGDIVLFRIDIETGRLTATGEKVGVDAPVCVKFVALD